MNNLLPTWQQLGRDLSTSVEQGLRRHSATACYDNSKQTRSGQSYYNLCDSRCVGHCQGANPKLCSLWLGYYLNLIFLAQEVNKDIRKYKHFIFTLCRCHVLFSFYFPFIFYRVISSPKSLHIPRSIPVSPSSSLSLTRSGPVASQSPWLPKLSSFQKPSSIVEPCYVPGAHTGNPILLFIKTHFENANHYNAIHV